MPAKRPLSVKKTILLALLISVLPVAGLHLALSGIPEFMLRPPSGLYGRFGQTAPFAGRLPTDSISADTADKARAAPPTIPFYIIKDGATDCSFVSALMLMLRRDPLFVSRVIRPIADSSFAVKFYPWEKSVVVTAQDLEAFHHRWKSTRKWYNTVFPGYLPKELEILRCAYYNWQAEANIRCCRGSVHPGGFPAYDLLTLSGVSTALSIVAEDAKKNKTGTFGNSLSSVVEYRRSEGGTCTAAAQQVNLKINDPLQMLDTLENYLIVLSSAKRIPLFLKSRLVPNHAYYYLGTIQPGRYVLGDSYHTRRPVVVKSTELAGCFRAMDFIEINTEK